MTAPALHATTYDRADCAVGLVHVGFGAFHRAHQAVYLDDYMEATGDLRWGIAAVNLRASESAAFTRAATEADGYLLKSIAPDGSTAYRTVRSHVAHVDAAQDLDAALALVARASVHVLSMTVTESGYALDEDWGLDTAHPAIAAELAGGPVQTIYGFLTAALARRRQAGGGPITLLCCDNIRSNGKVLEGALLSYLRAGGRDALADWLTRNATFPCAMVDRITPRATEALECEARGLFPAHAAAPIHAEAFSQWVLTDRFAAPMPDLAQVGVQIVADVEPYEEAKIRILNGGHTGLCYLGALAGHTTFDQAMADPALRPAFDAWEAEVLHGLPPSIPFDTTAYLAEIAQRFENPGIADQLARICMDGYSKMGLYIRPTLAACLAKGRAPHAGYACVASWVVYARRVAAGTMPIAYTEPFWDTLAPLLPHEQEEALARDAQLWGDLPTTHATFVPDLVRAIQEMDTQWPV
ncbi:MAG: mannitol dehydrogenase family protein [Shimia sp.]